MQRKTYRVFVRLISASNTFTDLGNYVAGAANVIAGAYADVSACCPPKTDVWHSYDGYMRECVVEVKANSRNILNEYLSSLKRNLNLLLGKNGELKSNKILRIEVAVEVDSSL